MKSGKDLENAKESLRIKKNCQESFLEAAQNFKTKNKS